MPDAPGSSAKHLRMKNFGLIVPRPQTARASWPDRSLQQFLLSHALIQGAGEGRAASILYSDHPQFRLMGLPAGPARGRRDKTTRKYLSPIRVSRSGPAKRRPRPGLSTRNPQSLPRSKTACCCTLLCVARSGHGAAAGQIGQERRTGRAGCSAKKMVKARSEPVRCRFRPLVGHGRPMPEGRDISRRERFVSRCALINCPN